MAWSRSDAPFALPAAPGAWRHDPERLDVAIRGREGKTAIAANMPTAIYLFECEYLSISIYRMVRSVVAKIASDHPDFAENYERSGDSGWTSQRGRHDGRQKRPRRAMAKVWTKLHSDIA